jgi:stress response protein YsnF
MKSTLKWFDERFLIRSFWQISTGQTKTIEVIETAEQAVVSKSAHIAEEVVVSKDQSEHEETVHDTVRRQQVEVERVGRLGNPVKKAG